MKYDYLIFDFSRMISNQLAGIVKSINFALEHHSFEHPLEKEICTFIGSQIEVT